MSVAVPRAGDDHLSPQVVHLQWLEASSHRNSEPHMNASQRSTLHSARVFIAAYWSFLHFFYRFDQTNYLEFQCRVSNRSCDTPSNPDSGKMSLAVDYAKDDGSVSPTRPSSSWTMESVFADSAISVQTPAVAHKETNPFELDEDSLEASISDRLNGLVSEIWAFEQEGAIRGEKRRKITQAVEEIEAALEYESQSEGESDNETDDPASSSISPEIESTPIAANDLETIRASLGATVESMRMRQQEQRHLHQLTVEKLEAVARRCIQQEQRLREFGREIAGLEEDNYTLSQENQVLHIQLNNAQSECAKREVAVNAMSSAVSGLEGYVNGSPSPERPVSSRKIITRGKGRFRGRYYADEPTESPVRYEPDGASDGKALHEGVTAWLRGFRDVEEELRAVQSIARGARAKELRDAPRMIDDEWGDFETATSA